MTFLPKTFRPVWIAVFAVTLNGLALAGAPIGVVSHINLLSDKSEDISTLEAWKKTYIKEGMSDQEKTIAIFNSIVKYRHQANPPREYLTSEMAGGHVHDPLKSFHVYGYGQCCCAAAEVQGLANYIGLPARGRPITVHSVAEVFYDNSWHLIDPSVMNYHIKDDGKIAGVDEIHQAVSSWLKEHPEFAEGEIKDRDKKLRTFAKNGGWKKGPALLSKSDQFYGEHGVNTAGWHGWSSTMIEYSNVEEPNEFYNTMGYQLNVQLRPGEKITRNFFSPSIEYTNNCSPTYYKELQDRKVLGIQTKLGDKAPGRVGNGSLEWNVPLSPDSLKAVALSADNLSAAGTGVGPAEPGKPGSLVLRFPSSYVYVGGKANVKATVATGGGVSVSFSDNNGLGWKELAKIDKSGEQTLDLTPLLARRYDYRLKFELTGTGTSLDGVLAKHDFQCSQAALPVITEGQNKITFAAGPQEGTVTVEGATDTDVARKHNQLTVADFHPVLSGIDERLRMKAPTGTATFNVATPGDMTRIRVSTNYRARDAKRDGFELQVSYDNGKTFKPVPNGKLEGGIPNASRYIIIDDVPPSTRQAQVRLAGRQNNTTLIFDLRIDADYTEPSGGFKPVKITYVWEENGQEKTHTHVAKSVSDAYTINCGPGTKVKGYSMELAGE